MTKPARSRTACLAALAAGAMLIVGSTASAAPSAKNKTFHLTAVTTVAKQVTTVNSTYKYAFELLNKGKKVGRENMVCSATFSTYQCGHGVATINGIGRRLHARMRWSSTPTGGPGGPGEGTLDAPNVLPSTAVASQTFKVQPNAIKKGKRFAVVMKRLLTPPISAYTGPTKQGKQVRVTADATGKVTDLRVNWLWQTPGCPTTRNRLELVPGGTGKFKQRGRSFTVKVPASQTFGEAGTVTGTVGKKKASGKLAFHQAAANGAPACDSGSVSWTAKK